MTDTSDNAVRSSKASNKQLDWLLNWSRSSQMNGLLGDELAKAMGSAIQELHAIRHNSDNHSPETSERSPNDYAIEHGGYLAKSAEDFLTVLNDVAMAECGLATWDEEDPEYAGAKALVDQAWERRHDHWTGLQSAIYEFRKRAERANAQKALEPHPLMTPLPADEAATLREVIGPSESEGESR